MEHCNGYNTFYQRADVKRMYIEYFKNQKKQQL
jgi:hypothetical protein